MARKKGPQVQQAYDYIKDKILSFELAPGTSVSDHALEQKLDMSRSPIREAILLLTANGLLEALNLLYGRRAFLERMAEGERES